jgi:hypothetical protein
MGHVDAGKSTLMGRLLHDLGQVSQKEVHKNQRESAHAGKVIPQACMSSNRVLCACEGLCLLSQQQIPFVALGSWC